VVKVNVSSLLDLSSLLNLNIQHCTAPPRSLCKWEGLLPQLLSVQVVPFFAVLFFNVKKTYYFRVDQVSHVLARAVCRPARRVDLTRAWSTLQILPSL
jgi:hypothetical protein